MFIAALFTIAKPWKQSRYPTSECIKEMWYIYTTDYYSSIKKNEIPGRQWLTSVILATQEAEIRRLMAQSQPGQIVLKTLS
jgi:hypothetical protein